MFMLSITPHGSDSYVHSVPCKLRMFGLYKWTQIFTFKWLEIRILISLLVRSHAYSWDRLWCICRIIWERSAICDIFLTKVTHCAISNWPKSKVGDPRKWTQCVAYWPSQFCLRFSDLYKKKITAGLILY